MRFDRTLPKGASVAWKMVLAALGWLILISGLHFWINGGGSGRFQVRLGYMPVVTNLAAPLLDHLTRDGDGIRFRAMKFASFAEMAEALRNGQIQAAFMIAPLAIVLHQQGEDVRVVMIGNRHESTLVARKELKAHSVADLEGRTVAVPMRYSGHNLCLLRQIEELGLENRLRIVEMNPPDMASALATGSLDAYYVGEPFAAMTLQAGESSLVQYVEEIWPGFICNLVVVRQSFIDSRPEAVATLVAAAARAGLWARSHPGAAARIANRYWKQPLEVVEYALSTPPNRVVYDRFCPKSEELQKMADLMARYGLVEDNTIDGLVEDRFARQVDLARITDLNSVMETATAPRRATGVDLAKTDAGLSPGPQRR
jgi:NitT/TauT family transport system substrate-binding protein